MQAVGKVGIGGQVAVQHRPIHGYYTRGLPAGTPLRYRLRTLWLELCLRLRVAAKGLVRGIVSGTGVGIIGRLYATVYRADGRVEHLGLLCTRVVTDAAVGAVHGGIQAPDDANPGAGHDAAH